MSFDLPDLILAQARAEFHGLQLRIELDTYVEGEAYEEVLALYDRGGGLRDGSIWRERDGIWVQRAAGLPLCYRSVTAALDAWFPPANAEVHDLPTLTGWWPEPGKSLLVPPATARALRGW